MTSGTPRLLTIVGLALSLFASALGAVPAHAAHAQTAASVPTTRQRYTLPFAVVGGPVTVYGTQRYADGSTSVRFESLRPAGHSDAMLLYTVNAGNSSYAAAEQSSMLYKQAFAAPMVDGTVQTFAEGQAWGDVEEGDGRMRATMGGAYHRVAFIVTVITEGTDNINWVPGYLEKVSKAILARIP
jgi:hypothetical protein